MQAQIKMSYEPFEVYLFEQASQKSSKRYHFADRIREISLKKDDPKVCLQNGLRFLEHTCSLLYGYTSECTGMDEQHVIKHIPVVFDSALILSLVLDTGINPTVISSLQSLLKNSQSESEFWTYFLRNKSRKYDIFSDDIDDTGSVLMSLLMSNAISKEECVEVAEKMRQHFLFDMDGLIGIYLKPTSTSGKCLWKHYTESARIDIGSCLNCFWFLGSIGLDDILKEEMFKPTIDLLIIALGQIEKDEKVISHTLSYSNPNVLLFFLSRFVKASKFGETIFKDKLIQIVMKKLGSNYNNVEEADKKEIENDETVIDLACQIMVAIKMNLHNDKKYTMAKTYISLKLRKMLSLQLKDGSFPIAPIYDWKPYKARTASKAISTAFGIAAIKMVLDV